MRGRVVEEVLVEGKVYTNHKGHKFKYIGKHPVNPTHTIEWEDTLQQVSYSRGKIHEGTLINNTIKDRVESYAAVYVPVEDPNPENTLPDLDYGGCRVLGYAGLCDKDKDSQYFFKCHCGNTFKKDATRVIKVYNPSCGCSLDKEIRKVSASLFEKHMESWNPDTDNPLEKKLPVFKGIVGREKIAGYSLVDKEVYDVWSKIMWVFDSAGYVIASYSKDNCRRLGIYPPENRKSLTMFLHRAVTGLGHEVDKYKTDHVNGVVSDNRKINLRLSTTAENNYNKNKVNNKHGLLGVKFKATRDEYSRSGNRNKRWDAQVMINHRYKSKSFYTKEEASWYRDLMAVDLFGEFASLNHPENLEEYKSKLHTLHYK
ncbi:hypothetical protein AXI76_gp079 [Pseudoalteromonas phage H101]|uniref:Homing endonuclease n=1 Tax=Pseudoalteromonas phage H101 TaxID=1654919 RepID=A0A0H4J241_9CAUD|nr:hypothetical protein AXI76_gp079 [Pseudoalteromonas phage H101]AKO60980.1 hypothetical protein [Pseudoalteromonas phage H101]